MVDKQNVLFAHMMEYYSPVTEAWTHTTTWINLENTLSEISPMQKLLVCASVNKNPE